jgi:hypothetical protein
MDLFIYDPEKLVVYVPRNNRFQSERLRTIISATKKVAQDLGIRLDGVFKRNTSTVSVYYEMNGSENWVYSDWESTFNENDIYDMIRGLAFALTYVHHRNPGGILSNG